MVPPPEDFNKKEGEEKRLGGWFPNFFRMTKAENNPKSLANIPSPYVEYAIFCTFKTVQAAAFVGGMIAKPCYMYYHIKTTSPDKVTVNTTKIARSLGRKLQGRMLLAALFSGPFIITPIAVFLNNFTRDSLKKRCYEIRCDSREIYYDRATLLMGFCGWYWKRFQGAVDFINIVTFYTAFRYKFLQTHTQSSNLDLEFQFVNEDQRYESPEAAELDMRELTGYFLNKKRRDAEATESKGKADGGLLQQQQ